MKIKSLDEAKEIAYQKIGIDLSIPNRPMIMDKYTLDFDWGYVFYYNGKKAIENNNSEFGYIGNAPILVDKFDGNTKYVGGVGSILDSQLEEYREIKGYPHSIKFPLKEDISDKTDLEKVKALFTTGEIFQIQIGIRIIEENSLVDTEELRKIIHNNIFPERTFEEMIASQFKLRSINLGSQIGNVFPIELNLFDDCTELSISGAKLDSISNNILMLPQLKKIVFWMSEVEEISSEVLKLDHLESIEIFDAKFGKQAIQMIDQLTKENQVRIE